MSKIPIILDGDPGHDDAIAWMLAKSNPDFEIIAVTTVAGNQTCEKVTYNARRICALLGIDAPVARGRDVPIIQDLVVTPEFHGETGLDGPALPEPNRPESELYAPELMAKVISESKEKVKIFATGPQSNVGALLLAHPELHKKIESISIMGGGIQNGNYAVGAEFNILTDPEAMDIELKSGIPFYMAGLDVTEKALVYPEDKERIRAVGNQIANVVADWLEFFFIHHAALGWAGSPLHDPCAVAVQMHPEIFTIEDMHVDVELDGQYTRGATVGDRRANSTEIPNAHVLMNVEREKFIELLISAVKSYDGWEVKI